MKCFFTTLSSVLLLAGCAASDQDAELSLKKSRTVLSQSTVPVSYDEHGKPFLMVNEERIGIDFDANLKNGESQTEFLMTKWKDQNGRIGVDFDSVPPSTKQPGNDEIGEPSRVNSKPSHGTNLIEATKAISKPVAASKISITE
jgi:hypothetical protein